MRNRTGYAVLYFVFLALLALTVVGFASVPYLINLVK